MPRKNETSEATGPDWFLVEWMRTLKVKQADLSRETGWSKATVNDIYHGKTGYYRQILNECARALRISPYELLLHPDDAMAIRRLKQSALQIAADRTSQFIEQNGEIRKQAG